MTSAYSNSSRALAFLSETSEDAIAALKGLVGGVGSAKYLDTSEDKLSTISTQIDSNRDEDRIVALTRIVAIVSKGRDASQFLPAVLKLTSCSNLDVRKLVYIVLLRYANSNPDLTLLSINSFQRDLSDPSPLIRSMALRVLSSIKVSMVAPIVIMAVSKATRDPNVYVRKIAALAVPKCYQINKAQLDTLLESLSTLLADRSPLVLGAALSAYQQVCPERWDLLHQNFRKLCHALSDMDEWGQITALNVLARYARANFVAPSLKEATKSGSAKEEIYETKSGESKEANVAELPAKATLGANKDQLEDFLSSDVTTTPSSASAAATPVTRSALPSSSGVSTSPFDMDRDLELLLAKSQNLLHSRNAAVVMAAARLTYYLAPPSQHLMLVRPLIRLLRSSPDIKYVVLLNIVAIARQNSALFAPYVTSFFLESSHEEPIHVSLLNLDIMVTVCNKSNLSLVLSELVTHIRSPEDRIAIHAVSCLGKLASKQELEANAKCLSALLNLLKRRKSSSPVRDVVVARAVLVVKNLVSDDEASEGDHSNKTAAIVYRLAALLFGTVPKTTPSSSAEQPKKKLKAKVLGKGAILHPAARASILWLLGQHARKFLTVTANHPGSAPRPETRTLAELVLPDILRRCAINFGNEASVVKLQILTVSSKVFAYLPTVLTATPALQADHLGRAERLVSTITKLHFYLLKLARYDPNFDVRDRARFCKGLTSPLVDRARQAGSSSGGGTPVLENGNLERGQVLAEADSIQRAISAAARSVGENATEDDADLKGVRLRREQVIHVLFEGKSHSHEEKQSQDVTRSTIESSNTGGLDGLKAPEIGSMSLALDGKLVKGWLTAQLPAWTDKATSSELREPPEVTQPSLPSLKSTNLSNLKSFSSSDFASSSLSDGPVVLTPTQSAAKLTPPTSRSGNITPIDPEAPTAASSQIQQERYKDLDSFLDESEEEEEDAEEADDDHLVDSAPEDDEYEAQQAWVQDDAGEEEDEEEEETDDEEEEEEATEDDE